MWSFLIKLFRRPRLPQTVVVIDSEEVGRTYRYQVTPVWLLVSWGVTLLMVFLVGVSIMAFTPLRTYIPGYATDELKRNARLNAMRVDALQDSVSVQRHYIRRLQQLVTGQVDSAGSRSARPQAPAVSSTDRDRTADRVPEPASPRASGESSDHGQPAITPSSFVVAGQTGESERRSRVLPNLSLPVESPVDTGFPTRNFDAADGHYGIDLAVSEGTLVRAVGEGYVVVADWTQEGGYTIAVQHSDGYLSVYKHNRQLLKQAGDRVQGREALAVSGNSGEVTTGPHLHFELWRNGLAQDPRPYVTGW